MTNKQSADVFDFDQTIYDGDSTIDFYLFCLRRHPNCFKYFPGQVYHALKYYLKKEELLVFKTAFFRYLNEIDNISNEVTLFWSTHKKKIKPWYLSLDKLNHKQIIISASPLFLLQQLTDLLKVDDIIATDVDPANGMFHSPNCHDTEKVIRLKEKYPDLVIERFYSDSLSDLPLAKLAKTSYLVKKNQLSIWHT